MSAFLLMSCASMMGTCTWSAKQETPQPMVNIRTPYYWKHELLYFGIQCEGTAASSNHPRHHQVSLIVYPPGCSSVTNPVIVSVTPAATESCSGCRQSRASWYCTVMESPAAGEAGRTGGDHEGLSLKATFRRPVMFKFSQ